jgi:ribosomal protein S18 acetylase RimI-like enzyme
MDDTCVTFRPVQSGDEAFLFEVYASTRAEELAPLALDADKREIFLKSQFEAQQQDYKKRFPDSDHRVILVGDQPAGYLHISTNDQEIRILDIALAPGYRHKGLGTRMITDLIERAAGAHKCVRVYVERFNPALRLFEHLGFSPVTDIGTHYLLESSTNLD